jgi:hypothetical protein
MDEMICLIAFENVMMHQRMRLERIPETAPRLVHEKSVQRPFKKRCEDRSRQKSNRKPKEK